jgi:hypothetical protein
MALERILGEVSSGSPSAMATIDAE